ncbi:MAG: apolipoprotein N-acyltransferase [Flavobacteriales bacterium]|nr:apolipoprotein N-acyltransferase [Flavobacteriales bacterium]
MRRLLYIAAMVVSGGLFALGWPGIGNMPWFLFVAFVPILWLEDELASRREAGESHKGFFWYAFLAMFLWNMFTTWWIWCVKEGLATKLISAGTAFILNGLFMAIVLRLFRFAKRHLGVQRGHIAFVLFWMTFEYLHYHWDLSYPWLTLGNAWSDTTSWIQWYEYTGVSGGSLWVLLMNVLLYRAIRDFRAHNKRWKIFGGISVSVIFLPLIWSTLIRSNYQEPNDPIDLVVIQPNIDPYSEKFGSMTPQEQLQKMLSLAQPLMDENVDYVIGPETALPQAINCDRLDSNPLLEYINAYLAPFPDARMVTGFSCYRNYDTNKRPSETARKREDGTWMDFYNSALQTGGGDPITIYHKSQLVLGVEKMPFPWLFNPIQELIFDLGGTTGTLGTQKERTLLTSSSNDFKIAPVICWESVYGDYLGEYMRNGADAIFIITNDGWWDNTPGSVQHLAYARLLAIEFRRGVGRSANTGISGFISPLGEVIQPTGWWTATAIRDKINASDEITFYARYGDFLYRISAWLGCFLLLFAIAIKLKNGKQNKKESHTSAMH